MFVAFLRGSRFLRALTLTTAVFSFLLWLYIVLRIVFNHVNVRSPFISSIPSLSFWVLGGLAFALSFGATLVYLWLWGRFRAPPMVWSSYEERGP